MIKIIIALALAMSLSAMTIADYKLIKASANLPLLNVYLGGMASGIYTLNSVSNGVGICFPKDFAGFKDADVHGIIEYELDAIAAVDKNYPQTDPVELVYLIGLLRHYPCTLPEPEKDE